MADLIELCKVCGEPFCLSCSPFALTECEADSNLECTDCQDDCAACLAAMRDDHAAEVTLSIVQEGP